MFTGLIQAVGRIVAREPRGGDLRLHIAFADLARISHHPSAADADPLAVTGRTPSSRLDVVSATPAPSSGRSLRDSRRCAACAFTSPLRGSLGPCAPPQRRLDALATKCGEKCGLERSDVAVGESIAVSGVCLTVVAFDGECWAADVSNETLSLTTLGKLPVGAAVNLERALRASDRLGGHMVSGHVDGIGQVAAIVDDGRSQRWRFSAAPGLLRFIAGKGSVAIDGVSLTVNAVDNSGFEVNLVPHTIMHTAFAQTTLGAAVNIEVDVVARYVDRLLQTRDESNSH